MVNQTAKMSCFTY